MLRSAFVLLAMLLMGQGMARADVWAYVNEKGVPHFASERLDERYELYFSDQAPEDSTRARAVPLAPSRLLAFFEISPDYKAVRPLLRQAAREQGLDYELLQALIATESGFDPAAVSPKGAVGLMQVMPAAARAAPHPLRERAEFARLDDAAEPGASLPQDSSY